MHKAGYNEGENARLKFDSFFNECFIDRYGNEKIIHDNYPSYVCGFSKDGNSFALADDGALRVLRRSEVSGPGAGI